MMMGVTIGTGEWRGAAEVAAQAMRRATELECVVVHELPAAWPAALHPSWLKCRVFDFVPAGVDRVLVFDADALAVRPWREWQDARHDLSVVRHPEHRAVRTEKELYGLWEYWNAGLFVVHRRLEERLRRVLDAAPRYGSWLEQTALVKAFLGMEKHWLPTWCNSHVHCLNGPNGRERTLSAAAGAIEGGAAVVHFTGGKMRSARDVLEMMEAVEGWSN